MKDLYLSQDNLQDGKDTPNPNGCCSAFRRMLKCVLCPFLCLKSDSSGTSSVNQSVDYFESPKTDRKIQVQSVDDKREDTPNGVTASQKEPSESSKDINSNLQQSTAVERLQSNFILNKFDKAFLERKKEELKQSLNNPRNAEELLEIARIEDKERIRELESQNSANKIQISILEARLQHAKSRSKSNKAILPYHQDTLVAQTVNNLIQQQHLLRQATLDKKLINIKETLKMNV
jgi:hypothetical protein